MIDSNHLIEFHSHPLTLEFRLNELKRLLLREDETLVYWFQMGGGESRRRLEVVHLILYRGGEDGILQDFKIERAISSAAIKYSKVDELEMQLSDMLDQIRTAT
jgi:hypothetical protein